jgi:predicted kinase
MKQPEMVIFIGIPASGKSTFFARNFFVSHIRINLDTLRTRAREAILINDCLSMKQNIVIDNTNVTKHDRKKYIDLAGKHGYSCVGYYFKTSVKECIERNNERNSKSIVPSVAIFAKHKKLELPSMAEGFDKLFYVQIGSDGQFIVEEWQEDIVDPGGNYPVAP